jgi:Glycine zipper
MRGWQRMDRDIQRRIAEAEASGDPEAIRKVHESAATSYAEGAGLVAGATIGTMIFPGVGTIIGGIAGAVLGNKISKD